MNNYKKIVEKDFIYYNIIAIKWDESTWGEQKVIGPKRPVFETCIDWLDKNT